MLLHTAGAALKFKYEIHIKFKITRTTGHKRSAALGVAFSQVDFGPSKRAVLWSFQPADVLRAKADFSMAVHPASKTEGGPHSFRLVVVLLDQIRTSAGSGTTEAHAPSVGVVSKEMFLCICWESHFLLSFFMKCLSSRHKIEAKASRATTFASFLF